MHVVGLDIGGANLKASDGEHRSLSRSFALWQHPDRLGEALQSLLGEFARPQHLAVTMTGELADCFETKAEGVARILRSITAAVDVPVHVWQTSGEFVPPQDASDEPRLTAAANWHALATWAGRMAPAGSALLVDMGSTTTDIIPLLDGLPATRGNSDCERLAAGELVYTGCRRTPLCAIARVVHVPDLIPREPQQQEIPLAAEWFATMHDVALILGAADEDSAICDTADGRPATVEHARSRLARMLCCDRSELTDDQLGKIAIQLRDAQCEQLATALHRVVCRLPMPPESLLICGEGEGTIRSVLDEAPGVPKSVSLLSLGASLGPEHSTAACAFALARLGTERIR